MVRRPKIEFVEDADGVRIDVTSPLRVDLALREVHKGFEIRIPEFEARRLALVDAFVHGRKVRARRSFPDWLFEINVTAPRRGEPWDSATLRVSVPADTSGALSSRRYIDLAPQSDEARRFAALAEQETVRVCWVTEGVELLYRLPNKQRDYWRETLATNATLTDEERAARYEQLLAGATPRCASCRSISASHRADPAELQIRPQTRSRSSRCAAVAFRAPAARQLPACTCHQGAAARTRFPRTGSATSH